MRKSFFSYCNLSIVRTGLTISFNCFHVAYCFSYPTRTGFCLTISFYWWPKDAMLTTSFGIIVFKYRFIFVNLCSFYLVEQSLLIKWNQFWKPAATFKKMQQKPWNVMWQIWDINAPMTGDFRYTFSSTEVLSHNGS